MTAEEVRALLLTEARKCEPRPWRSTGIKKWCDLHGANRGHVSEFMNGKRLPTSDILNALGLEWPDRAETGPARMTASPSVLLDLAARVEALERPDYALAANQREKARRAALHPRTDTSDRADYAGPIDCADDFARSSPERQRKILDAIHRVIVLYQEPWAGGPDRRRLLAAMLNEWLTMASIVARQAAKCLETT